MGKDLSLEEVLAQSLVNYNSSKRVSIECKDQDITEFCCKRIVSYCNSVERNDKSDIVIKALEQMKQENPKHMEDIDQSIKDLHVEKHATLLTDCGQAQADAKTDEEWEKASISIKEECDFIPTELVADVKENLTIKQDMQEFARYSEAITNAIAAININRYEDLNAQTSSPVEATE